jgi:hypothetical protein
MHLSRSVFSEQKMDILLWLLQMNGSQDIPSVRSVKYLQKKLQNEIGISTLEYNGKLGHKYFVNSLHDIIRQVCS